MFLLYYRIQCIQYTNIHQCPHQRGRITIIVYALDLKVYYFDLGKHIQGRHQDLAGGGGRSRNIFFSFENLYFGFDILCIALLGGKLTFRMQAPPRIFLKWCNLVRFGVYLDQISKVTIFYIKIKKIHVKVHINYSCTHMPGSSGAYDSCPESFLKMWCSLVRFGVYFDQIVF